MPLQKDYHLLHATKGTALCRLVASLTETIQQRELQHVPNARRWQPIITVT